jgi:hypothetical protein
MLSTIIHAAWRRAAFIALACIALTTPAMAQGPGPQQLKLKELEGNWEVTIKNPDGSSSVGEAVYKMECGDMWLTSDMKIELMGMPFQGKGIDGYNPLSKKYLSVWVDPMSPAPMMFEGDFDSSGKVLTMTSDAVGPDQQPAKWRSVTTYHDKDHHTFVMYLTGGDGKEQEMMTAEYRRK